MIQSINGSSLQFPNEVGTNTNTLVAASTNSTTTATSTQTAANSDGEVSTSVQGDTVSISKKALETFAAFSENSIASGGSGVSEESFTDSTALASAANSAGIDEYTSLKNENQAASSSVSESSNSASSSSSELSSCSESKLKQMLSNGEISQSQYNAEIAKREAASLEDSSTDSDISKTKQTNS